jgi:hypothetical protein
MLTRWAIPHSLGLLGLGALTALIVVACGSSDGSQFGGGSAGGTPR